MAAHVCPPLAPCLSCLDRVLAEGVLYDGDEQVEALAIDAGLERAAADIAEEDAYRILAESEREIDEAQKGGTDFFVQDATRGWRE